MFLVGVRIFDIANLFPFCLAYIFIFIRFLRLTLLNIYDGEKSENKKGDRVLFVFLVQPFVLFSVVQWTNIIAVSEKSPFLRMNLSKHV